MHRFVHVGFAFAGVPKMRDLEPIFTLIGDDWIRYTQNAWILWTDKPAAEIFVRIRPYIDAGDQVLITGLNLNDAFGLLAPWIWTWIGSKKPGQVKPGFEAEAFLQKWLEQSKSK